MFLSTLSKDLSERQTGYFVFFFLLTVLERASSITFIECEFLATHQQRQFNLQQYGCGQVG